LSTGFSVWLAEYADTVSGIYPHRMPP